MGELPALPCASAVGDASPAEGSLHGSTPQRWGNCRCFPARRRSGTLPRLKAPCMEARPRRWGNCRCFPARRRSGTLPRLKAPCMEARPRRWGNCRCFPARRRSGTLPRLKAPCMEARPRRWGNCRCFPARRRSGMLPRLKAPRGRTRPFSDSTVSAALPPKLHQRVVCPFEVQTTHRHSTTQRNPLTKPPSLPYFALPKTRV